MYHTFSYLADAFILRSAEKGDRAFAVVAPKL